MNMRQLIIWQNRLKKFWDNPSAIWPFLKKHFYYNWIADSYIPYYENLVFLNYQETINSLIRDNRSFVRFGDEAFDMVQGIGLYFNNWRQKYNPELGKRYKEVLGSNHPKLLVGFNPELILMSKVDFKEKGISEQHQYWTNTKVFLKDYINSGQVYGSALCFHERYNDKINYKQIFDYFRVKNLVVVASNTARFKDAQLGQTTDYIDGPSSDAWDSYQELIAEVRRVLGKYSKEGALVLIALGPTSKVMAYDLTLEGYTVWDTGQLFDLALSKLVK